LTPLSRDTTPFKERRAFQRYPCRAHLAPRVELVDISEGGAQMEGPWPVPLRAVVPIPMENVFGHQLRTVVAFQVLHVRPIPETGRYRIHGHFLEMSPAAAESLRSAMRRLEEAPSA
jgi:hypothetical protein